VADRFRPSARQKLASVILLVLLAAVAVALWRGRLVDEHRIAAAGALRAQRFDDAARELDALAALWVDVRSRREALVRARVEAAHRLIEKARSLIEESRVNLYRKGATLSQTFFKDLDAAAGSVRRSVELAETPEARLVLGRIAMLLGDYEGARREYAAALTIDPKRPAEGRLGQARAYVQEAAEELFAGNDEQGLFLLESARGIFDSLPGLARRLQEGAVESELVEAWRLIAAGDLDAAIAHASARTAKAEEFFLALGLAQFRREPGREALQSLTAAIDARPNYYQAFLWRGLMLRRLGSPDFARRDVERALEIHPRYARARSAMAELGSP
jgi:Tfp pilus assembly protein PilF